MAVQAHYKHSRSQYWLLVTRSWSGGVRYGPVGYLVIPVHTGSACAGTSVATANPNPNP